MREPQDEVHAGNGNLLAGAGEDRVASLERVGDLLLTSNGFAQALSEFRKITEDEAWPDLTPCRRSSVLARLAQARSGLGDLDGALSSGANALAELESGAETARGPLGLAHAFLANTHRKRGDHEAALSEGLLALDLLRDTSEHSEVASLQLNCGGICLREGRLRAAERHFEDALATYRRIEDRAGMAKAYNSLGVVYNNLCQWQNAITCLKRAAEIDESLGNFTQIALRCLNLGIVHYHVGDWGSARSLLERSLEMSRAVGDAIGVARASIGLARIERWSHAYFRAERLVRDAIAATRESGARRELAAALEEAGALAAARRDVRGAETRFAEALAISSEISPVTDHAAELERRIAEIALARGLHDEALHHGRRAYGAAVRIMDRRLAAEGLRVLGNLFRARGEKDRARSSFTRAIHALERIGAPLELAKTLRDAGRLDGGLWCTIHEARGYLNRSESLFRDLGLIHETGAVLLERARLEIAFRNYLEAMNFLREAEWACTETAEHAVLEDVLSLRRELEGSMARETALVDTELLSLNKIVRAREADLESVFRRILDTTRAHRGFVVADEAGRQAVRVCDGMTAVAARVLYRELAAQHAERLVSTEPVISYGDFARGASDVLSYVLIPIVKGGRSVGALYVDRIVGLDVSPFGRLELHFLSGVAQQVGALLEGEAATEERAGAAAGAPFGEVVTQSRRMLDILDILKRVASSSSTILLQGETGTGKGLLAYEVGRLREGPFVTINCADLSETVLESELFGHARNAFTGAGEPKKGLFEVADGGTVFIDEIDKTSRNFQERLLRVVDRREFKPVGATKLKTVDCRIVVAANRDLRGLVEKGEFLKDLYYRLRVIAIELPPLRERREDIPALVEYFLDTYQSKMGKSGIRFSSRAMECLKNHEWQGNVRDVENEVERTVALTVSGDEVDLEGLSAEVGKSLVSEAVSSAFGRKSLSRVVEEIEERMVAEALEHHKGNKTRAAAELGLTRRGLKNKMTRYGIA